MHKSEIHKKFDYVFIKQMVNKKFFYINCVTTISKKIKIITKFSLALLLQMTLFNSASYYEKKIELIDWFENTVLQNFIYMAQNGTNSK